VRYVDWDAATTVRAAAAIAENVKLPFKHSQVGDIYIVTWKR
jgi:hypothetical protein